MYQPLLKSKAIYQHSRGLAWTLISIIIFIFTIFGIGIFIIGSNSGIGAASILMFTLCGVMFVPIFMSIKLLLRTRHIKKLFKRRRYLAAPGTGFATHISQSVVHSELEYQKNKIHFNIIDDLALIGQPVWPASVSNEKAAYRIYDFKAEVYQRNRQGTNKITDKYYTILEIKLRKPVPHLVFDSKTANSQQFRSIYVALCRKMQRFANLYC